MKRRATPESSAARAETDCCLTREPDNPDAEQPDCRPERPGGLRGLCRPCRLRRSTDGPYGLNGPGTPGQPPAATPAVPPPAPKLAAIDPARLVGMTGTRISSLFGTPVFVRRDPPGEFWRYRGESCVLELFFYLRDGAQRVDHIETRAGSGAPLDQADCIASLRKRPAKG